LINEYFILEQFVNFLGCFEDHWLVCKMYGCSKVTIRNWKELKGTKFLVYCIIKKKIKNKFWRVRTLLKSVNLRLLISLPNLVVPLNRWNILRKLSLRQKLRHH
jgi:hypothetical protein